MAHVTRWYMTMMHQPAFAAVTGEAKLCEQPMRYTPPKKEAAPRADGAAKKEAAPKPEAAPKKEAAPKVRPVWLKTIWLCSDDGSCRIVRSTGKH